MNFHFPILLSAFFIIASSSICQGQDVTLETQTDVENFPSSDTIIQGNLTIEESNWTTDPITDLSPLIELTTIEGNLKIFGTDDLTNLGGLSGIESIGGFVMIGENKSLTNVNGLSNLKTIGEYLRIFTNHALQNLHGFSSLEIIGGYLSLRANDVLENVDGLSNLNFLGGDLTLENNDALQNINDLLGLNSIFEDLWIRFNHSLENVDGLSNIETINGYVHIHGNDGIKNIDGFQSLTSIGDYLSIKGNDSLEDLNGLCNLSSVSGSFTIEDNDALTDCCCIHYLLSTPNTISGNISISNNPSSCSSESEILANPCSFYSIILNPPCLNADNGSIQIQLNENMSPYTYIWTRTDDNETDSGIFNEEHFIIENLSEGTYELTVKDALDNVIIDESILLASISGIVFEIIELTTTNSSNGIGNGAINLTVTGGTPPYDYSVEPGGIVDNSLDNSFTIENLTQGEYDITVIDALNNEQTISITLLDETIPDFPCDEPLDIVILNDVSGSVDAVEYEESQQFFVDFINEVNIGTGDNDSRAAIVEWSSSGGQSLQIPMTGDLSTLQDYANYTRAFSGGTNPHHALTFGKDYLNDVARPDVGRVLILTTDGTGLQVSPSLVALADQYKALGYHIITIAFDLAYSDTYTREILRQVASIDLLAPGAPSYSMLDTDLAKDIVNLYLCPLEPGSSTTVYFNRDGAIDIIDIVPVDGCPNPTNVELTFTIEALRELSIPLGTPVTFYHNNPSIFGATPILKWQVPCGIPTGTIETFTVTLPVTAAANIFAIFNDDGSQSPPINFPITAIDEIAYSNNIADTTFCMDAMPTLQALKYTATPNPICNNTVIYVVNVCNISDLDATNISISDNVPAGFDLQDIVVNHNNCATDNSGNYDIPVDCCVSLTYFYDVSNAQNGNYNNQGVDISGPTNQVYLNYDGLTSPAEDVVINGIVDCPSTTIDFTKEVSVSEVCDDAFVVFTFTIDNQLNVPLHGLVFSDTLPSPVNWAFEPYNLSGLSIANATVNDNIAQFIIDEIPPNTIATFSMDAALGEWTVSGTLSNTATLTNIPDLENGILQTLTSNTTSTMVMASPEIEIASNTIDCSTIKLSATLNGQSNGNWSWVTTGSGVFSDASSPTTTYQLGSQDFSSDELLFSVSIDSDCDELNESIIITTETSDPIPVNISTCEGTSITYEGVTLNIGDTQEFALQNSEGCDSTVLVTVIGLPFITESLTFETCKNTTIDYNDTTLLVGNHVFTFQSVNGCDSIVTVDVLGLPIDSAIIDFEVCQGGSVNYYDTTLLVGNHEFTFQNANGCDSVVTVNISGLPSEFENLIIETCENDSVIYNNTILYVGDSLAVTLQTDEGCDSTVLVTVVGLPIITENLTFETCANNTIDYNGTTLNAGDSKDFVFQSINGCDSIVVVNVLSLPIDSESVDFEICEGGSVSYNDTTLLVGNHEFTFQNLDGCDSVVTVAVTVFDGLEFYSKTSKACTNENDGIIEFTDFQQGAAPLQFSINGIDYQSSPLFENLSEGTYELFIEDGNGCIFKDFTEIVLHPTLIASIPEEIILPCDEEEVVIEPEISSFADFYQYSLYDDIDSLQLDGIVSQPGEYSMEIIDVCDTVNQKFQVVLEELSDTDFIYVPNAFSPNGDGINDEFRAYHGSNTKILEWEMSVYNRWGNLIWKTTTEDLINNQIIEGWNGRYEEKIEIMPAGVYAWFYKVKLEKCRKTFDYFKKGDVTIIR